MNPKTSASTAVVIGAGMAGLAAARALAGAFERVVVIERDWLPAEPVARSGAPQGRHIHVLKVAGSEAIERLWPGMDHALLAAGASTYDPSLGRRSWQGGEWQMQRDLGMLAYSQTRPLLEWLVRQRVSAQPGVSILEGTSVTGISLHEGAVAGVTVTSSSHPDASRIDAALVVDAGGRSSRGRQWLQEAGLAAPSRSEVHIAMRYVTALVCPEAGQAPWHSTVVRDAPNSSRVGLMVPLEHGRWHITLSGRGHQVAEPTRDGMLAFARELPHPAIAHALERSVWLEEPGRYQFPSNLRWHFDAAHLPQGWLPMGDAVCSMNPAYGQGMTVALQEGEALLQTLQENPSVSGLAARYLERVGQILHGPWLISSVGDFAHPGTTGDKPEDFEPAAALSRQCQQWSKASPEGHLALERYLQLLDPWAVLREHWLQAAAPQRAVANG